MGIFDPPATSIPGEPGQPGPTGPIGLTISSTVAAGQTYTLNPAFGTEFTLTLTGNASLAVAGMINGSVLYVCLVQDTVGGRTVTLPTDWLGLDSLALTTTANTYEILTIWRSPLGTHVKRVAAGALPLSFWSPNSLPTQRAWFAANSIGAEPGSPVETWSSVWGTGVLAKPGSGAGAPALGVDAGEKYVSFKAADSDLLAGTPYSGTINYPFTFAMLSRVTDGGNPESMVGSSDSLAFNIQATGSPQRYNCCSTEMASLNPVVNQWDVIVVVMTGTAATSFFRQNGEQATLTGMTSFHVISTLWLGRNSAGLSGDVDIADLMIIGAAASSSEVASIETYLGNKRDAMNAG